MKKKCLFFTILCFIFFSHKVWGSQIMGGGLSMQQIDSIPGKYLITLHVFVNSNNFTPNEENLLKAETNYVRVIRKRGNLYLPVPKLSFDKFETITHSNPACQSANGSYIREYKYTAQVEWDINDFDDNQGYYLAYERCCRDNNIFTINKSGETGMVFYLEFPSLKKYPHYSSPVFSSFNGQVICINKLFTFNLSASDANKDILKYRLVNPWKGTSTSNSFKPIAGSVPYNLVDWRTGYSEYNVVNGDPTLSIDPDSGLLTVKAMQTGTFIFTVQVDKYRDGEWIGLVRHDFQFIVTICSSEVLTAPVITQNNEVIQSTGICDKQTITLETEFNTDWSYQWQKNGRNIPEAKSITLNVSEPGDYTVVKSLKNECASDTTSQMVKVVDERSTRPEIVSTATNICDGQPIKLSVAPKPNTIYTWYNGANMITQADFIDVSSPGIYMIEGLNTQSNCLSLKDTIIVKMGSKPAIPTFSTTEFSICPGDSTKLEVPVNADYNYQWLFNGVQVQHAQSNVFFAKDVGKYEAELKNLSGCTNKTPVFNITTITPANIQFDPIPVICKKEKVDLKALPVNGVFSGKGITGNTFDPGIASVGKHTITYTIGAQSNCGVSKTQEIEVKPDITLGLPKNLTVQLNETIVIPTKPSQNDLTFDWTPVEGLNNPVLASPLATITNDIVYTAKATSPDGCTVEESVQINVGKNLIISTAFSPNEDGLNDFWFIKDIESFPESEIYIYNSWGELIFYAKGYPTPWDGKYKGKTVPVGLYLYKIDTKKDSRIYQGYLTIIY